MEKNNNDRVATENMVLCKYEDSVYEIPYKLFMQMAARTQDPKRKYIRYKEGAYLYSMSEREFNNLAHEANAVVKKNMMALVDMEIIDKFMEFYH